MKDDIVARLKAIGQEVCGKPEPKDFLEEVYLVKGFSIKRIAWLLKTSAPAVRYWLKKYGLYREIYSPKPYRRALALGYNSLKDFFQKNWKLTHEERAALLGVSPPTERTYYKGLLEKVEGYGK